MSGILVEGLVLVLLKAPVRVSSNVPADTFDTLSLRRLARSAAAQRWEVETGLEPLAGGGQELLAELARKGLSGELELLVPQSYAAVSLRTGPQTPASVPDEAGLAGAASVVLSAFSGFMPRGTFVRFGTHRKVYVTTTDRDGPGAVGVFPPLRADVAYTSMWHGDDVSMPVLLDVDAVQGMQYLDGVLLSVDRIRMVEAVDAEAVELQPLAATSTVYTVTVDTNGVSVALPSFAAIHFAPSLEELKAGDAVVLLGTLYQDIAYVTYTHTTDGAHVEELLSAGDALVLFGALYQDIAYVTYTHTTDGAHVEELLSSGDAIITAAQLYQDVVYVFHNVYDPAELNCGDAVILSGEMTQ